MPPTMPLYGDLLNGILFSMIFAFLTYKVINLWCYSSLEERNSIGLFRPIALWSCVGMTLISNWAAYYYSAYESQSKTTAVEENSDTTNTPTATEKECHFVFNGVRYSYRPSRAWSYGAFAGLVVTTAEVSLFNWPHTDEQALPGQFVWNLVVATANMSHPTSIKLIMGGINFISGMSTLWMCPRVYPFLEFAPILLGSTVAYMLAHFGTLKGHRAAGPVGSARPQSPPVSGLAASISKVFLVARGDETTPLSREPRYTWEHMRSLLAFGLVVCVMIHFFLSEVHGIMTRPGYFATGSYNICQTGILGATGFIASGALRHGSSSRHSGASTGSSTFNTNQSETETATPCQDTLVMVAMAFQASATPMAITDSKRYIEDYNPAFVQIATTPLRDHPSRSVLSTSAGMNTSSAGPSRIYKNLLLDTVLGISNAIDVSRLQRCFTMASLASASTSSDSSHPEEFQVHDRTFHIRVSTDNIRRSTARSDEEKAMSPFPFLGFLSMSMQGRSVAADDDATKRLVAPAGPHAALLPKSKERFVVAVHDVTLDRALLRAIHESTMVQHNRHNQQVMQDMMAQIATTIGHGITGTMRQHSPTLSQSNGF